MKLYIAGPITGIENYRANFDAAEAKLKEAGYEVINPAYNDPPFGSDHTEEEIWVHYMRRSLQQVCQADGVALLSGWSRSRGAQLEFQVARELGMHAHSVESWLDENGSHHAH